MSIKLFDVPKLTKEEILEEIWQEVEKIVPEWDDRSPLDPGVALAEAFATIVSNLYFSMDYFHNNLLIGFAELLGITPQEGKKAKASVTIRFNRVYYPFYIKKGTRFATNPLESGSSLTFSAIENVFVNDNNQTPNIPIEVTIEVECNEKGTIGNVPENAIQIIVDPLEASGEIISSSRGIGGVDDDNFETIRNKIVAFLSTSNRAVTQKDYEDLVKSLNYVQNCYIWARYNPDDYLSEKPGNVGVIPIPAPGFSFDDIKNQLKSFLEERAVLTANIILIDPNSEIPPIIKDFEITSLVVRIYEDYSIENVRQSLKIALESKFSPYNWIFGKTITLTDIYNIILSIQGVKEIVEISTEPNLPVGLMHFQVARAVVNLNNIHVII